MCRLVLRWGSGIVLTVAAVASVAADGAPEPTKVATPPRVDDAIKQAASAGKTLVLEFSTDWCSACKIFEKRTLPEARVQTALAKVLFVRYDAETAPGTEAAKRYGVHVYPTFVAVDQASTAVLRVEGALGANNFVEWVGKARAAGETEATMRASLAAQPTDPEVAIAAARWFMSRTRTREALEQFDRLAKVPAATGAQRAEASRTARHIRRIEQWKQSLLADTFAALAKDPANTTADELALATVSSGADAKSVRSAITSVLVAQTEADVLNDMIYVALAANVYDEAVRAAERMVALKRTPQLLDSYAETLYKSGDIARALAIQDEALAMPDGAGLAGLVRNRARFAAGTGESDEVIRLRARADNLWKRLAAADDLAARVPIAAAEGRPTTKVSVDDELVAYRKRLVETSRALAKACRASSGSEMEGYVRLKFDASGEIISHSIMLDQSAPAALHKCLAKELSTLKLEVPKRTTKETIAIEFR
ncbi:MAG: thioredoxin family protein [Kofleriaceae bacterium]